MALRFAICVTVVVCGSICHGAGTKSAKLDTTVHGDPLAYGDHTKVNVSPKNPKVATQNGVGKILKDFYYGIVEGNGLEYGECNDFTPKDVFFKLFNKNHPNSIIISNNDTSAAYINPEWRTRIFIHGSIGSHQKQWERIAKAYFNTFNNGEVNVIIVDWTLGLQNKDCVTAKNVNIVGEKVAVLLNFLINKFKDKPDFLNLLRIIGESMGALAMAITGDRVNKVHKKQENEAPVLREMLALDPTTPWFEDQPLLEDLDKNKARYVEVIHTDPFGLGFSVPIGHADFFANIFGEKSKLDNMGINYIRWDKVNTTKHFLAFEYYLEALEGTNDNEFWAVPCSNLEQLAELECIGEEVRMLVDSKEILHQQPKGIYALLTNETPPYAKGRMRHV